MTTGSRRTVTVAVLAVVVLALGYAVYSLGRSSASRPGESPTVAPTVTMTAAPTYEPTDQNGSPEPGLPVGASIAGGGGATTGPSQLPLGYSHDATGAANAATNYLIWMNSLRITDKAAADALAGATAADSATRDALIKSFDQLRSGMSDLAADKPEPNRGAYAIAAYSPERAVVYVWYPEVITDGAGETDNAWAIDAVTLKWSSNDWKLDGALITRTGGAAVDPADPAGNPTGAEKHAILRRTPADPGDIADSAHQTWFEYANAPH